MSPIRSIGQSLLANHVAVAVMDVHICHPNKTPLASAAIDEFPKAQKVCKIGRDAGNREERKAESGDLSKINPIMLHNYLLIFNQSRGVQLCQNDAPSNLMQ